MKKGQLTLFIIIGLAILVVIGFVLMISSNKPKTEQAAQDSIRVTQYVQSCLAQTGKDVLQTMGAQGGYYHFPQEFKRDTKQDPRNTQIVEMPPQSVVVWHEVHSCDGANGCVGDNRPPLCKRASGCPVQDASGAHSMQEQLELGIQEKMDNCLQFDTAFVDVGVEKQGVPKVTATIREKDILLKMDYPLRVTTSDKQQLKLDTFSSSLHVALPSLYTFARKIQDLERNATFLENTYLQLQSAYSGLGQPLPPTREMTLTGFRSDTWFVPDVRDAVQNDLLPLMNLVQIINAQESYAPVLPDNRTDRNYAGYEAGYYEYFTIKLDNQTMPYTASVEYPGTPIYFDINGRKYGAVRPESTGGAFGDIVAYLTTIRFTKFKFNYNVVFPVIIHLRDPAAFDGDGYQLDFGLQANIRNNNPLSLDQPQASVLLPESSISIAKDSQLVNHTYIVAVTDKQTQLPIERASILYECGSRYELGETNGSGVWSGKLPYCFAGGAIVIQADKYAQTGKEIMNTLEDGRTSALAVEMWPFHQKKVVLFKKIGDQDVRVPLDGNDQSLLQLTRIKETLYDDDIPEMGLLTFGNFSGTATQESFDEQLTNLQTLLAQGTITQDQYTEYVRSINEAKQNSDTGTGLGFVTTQYVDIIPGYYELDGTLIYRGNISIPKKHDCVGGSVFRSCTSVDYPEKNLTSWVPGGAILKGKDATAFSLSPEDVYSNKTLVLFVAEEPLPHTWDDMLAHKDLEEYLAYGRVRMIHPVME